ncbi:hypothetical protein [Salegentibacter mishustinae]|uniref:TonB C-terminal domain-containing protein n=1 Tax=Salegentibacter mishustinae TaxID=270918 RepID=A0A0Q9Z9P2_9FLAO|nr:hypothetical protein [Salegentibacter mishustinae]KRG29637.1 hypothetical protein APR42_16010 [Salegentibacter mishustinae]PZX67358.1 hypothetical protein LY54_00088 [Salegentibacter mishustinae]
MISFLFALSITAWGYYQATHRIGELEANDRIDDNNFKLCNEDKVAEYYGMNTDYIGGKKAIKNRILSELQSLDFKESGLLTYRFVVNCKGEIGRFRLKATNEDLQKTEVNSKNIQEIEKELRDLKNWNPAGNKSGYTYDSYYILNFKIENDKIVDIF